MSELDLSSLVSRQPAGRPEPDVVACIHHRKHSARRAKVEGLRRERLLFDDVLRKADRAWEAQRGEMVALIQATATAHEQRQKVGIVQKGSQHWTTQYRNMSASRLFQANPWRTSRVNRRAPAIETVMPKQPQQAAIPSHAWFYWMQLSSWMLKQRCDVKRRVGILVLHRSTQLCAPPFWKSSPIE